MPDQRHITRVTVPQTSRQMPLFERRQFVGMGLAAIESMVLSGCQKPGSTEESPADAPAAKAPEQEAPAPAMPAAPEQNAQLEELSETRFFFDTMCLIRGVMSPDVLSGAFERCDFFQKTLSAQEANSDIDRINKAGGSPVEVQPETAELIRQALRYCEETGGLFDITIGAASFLWDFKAGVVPDASELAKAIAHIDYTQVKVDDTTVQLLDPDARIDLGGVAKGYIADNLIAYLQEQGVKSGFVNLGGNVKTLGTKPDGSPWAVGIQDPNIPASSVDAASGAIAKIDSTGSSVVTSGLYERTFEKDGTSYWHILDPKTGYPVQTDVVSATVVSDRSIDGDGYTKSLFMWGSDAVAEFFEDHPELQGLIIHEDGSIWTSPGSEFVLR